jgi:hypothetical protein
MFWGVLSSWFVDVIDLGVDAKEAVAYTLKATLPCKNLRLEVSMIFMRVIISINDKQKGYQRG